MIEMNTILLGIIKIVSAALVLFLLLLLPTDCSEVILVILQFGLLKNLDS